MRPVAFAILLLSIAQVPAVAEKPAAEAESISFGANDWPWWRGPQRNGIASGKQSPPLTWSETENVLWKVPVPGRGHGSATVIGDQVFLAVADPEREVQSVLCLDRQTGERVWEAVAHEGHLETGGNKKASQASSTVAYDGQRLFINFLNSGAIFTTAFDMSGDRLWQTKISDYVVHQGYGSSPAPYKHLVIVGSDNKGDDGGAIAALDRASGEIVWKQSRPAKPNYSSPIILHVAGKDQLFLTGCDKVTSFDPLTGSTNWEIEGATTECVTSTVTDGVHIFTSGGYPRNHMAAVVADGSGTVTWENTVRAYVPSMLCVDGHLYATLDGGFATCLESDTGKELWKSRLGGTFSSSPVLVGNRIYATNEEGTTFVFKASPKAFEELAKNQLGESVFATPTICGSRIYTRVTHQVDGRRQEYLYCLGSRGPVRADVRE
ncbi:MAG: PQQ-binding-like beta-propeller repeat protein [Fuerstiella sp.]|nr:PQQ-binding-like beta-propeller repeat protein [Fuerstiella sp.]MCP4853890.1 PQQ-binding-like beta-propeller repeat protein [Fuerstiella sp.]